MGGVGVTVSNCPSLLLFRNSHFWSKNPKAVLRAPWAPKYTDFNGVPGTVEKQFFWSKLTVEI